MRTLLPLLLCTALCAATPPATIDLRVEDKPLATLLERIARQCDAGLSVHRQVQDRLDVLVTINARDAAWADAMLLLRQQYRLVVRLEGGRIVVEDADQELRRALVTRSYDVRHLTAEKPSFPGPSLATPEPGDSGSQLLPPMESLPSALSLLELIQQRVAPERWAAGGASIEERNGCIIVAHVPEVQAQVAALLRELEDQTLRQVQVRLWRLPAATAVAGELLDRAAFAPLAKTLGPPALAFVTGNEQQNHAYAGPQRSAIVDADVVQQSHDPIVSTSCDGLALDVQPQSTRAGVIVTCRFDAAVANEPAAATTLREDQGRAIMPIELPDRRRDTLRCSLLIADGGAAILRFGERAYVLQVEVYQPAKP